MRGSSRQLVSQAAAQAMPAPAPPPAISRAQTTFSMQRIPPPAPPPHPAPRSESGRSLPRQGTMAKGAVMAPAAPAPPAAAPAAAAAQPPDMQRMTSFKKVRGAARGDSASLSLTRARAQTKVKEQFVSPTSRFPSRRNLRLSEVSAEDLARVVGDEYVTPGGPDDMTEEDEALAQEDHDGDGAARVED